jgi:hypothetical protein
MQRAFWIGVAVSVALALDPTGRALAACPAGKISCASWCAKYRAGATDCLVGPGSCESKVNGKAACVADYCNPSNDSCKRLQDQEIKKMKK